MTVLIRRATIMGQGETDMLTRIDSISTPYGFDPAAVSLTSGFRKIGGPIGSHRAETNTPGVYAYMRKATDQRWWLCLRREGWANEPAIAEAYAADSRDWMAPQAIVWAEAVMA